MTAKKVYSEDGEFLSGEAWQYNAFYLLAHTDSAGLTTHYEYDFRGRKTSERCEDRTTTFAYDSLGFLERVSQNGASQVFCNNVEGEVVEQWLEDGAGTVENHMKFFYDDEGRKVKALRATSSGLAEDRFYYDEEGRLKEHVDPLGNTYQLFYTNTTNALNQQVEQKITTDPLGNRTVETYDANNHLSSVEKQDVGQRTIGKEEYFYDRSGNRAKRIVSIFQEGVFSRAHITTWKFDGRGRPLEEIEEGTKSTQYVYDSMGRLVKKTAPSGVVVSQEYDKLGRVLSLKSSEGDIHFEYVYEKGAMPSIARDVIRNLTWERSYNVFGEIIAEKRPDGSVIGKEYDCGGRCTRLILPDGSSIAYDHSPLHLRAVTRVSASGIAQYTHTYSAFDENGHVCQEALPFGLGETFISHDLLERPHAQETPWHSSNVEYGPSGLVMGTENSLFNKKKYRYDALDQLLREGDREYGFDSLGNPLDAQVNQLNQIVGKSDSLIFYDENGNPVRKHGPEDEITYGYDSLDRLKTLDVGEKKHLEYTYDPFSRLYSKIAYANQDSFWTRETSYYLYDEDSEIGVMDEQDRIVELKVLGLGIHGEVGAAVAIELDEKTYLPLHDFFGNIVALVDQRGALKEKCDVDAFGQMVTSQPSINPWRFCSKRTEEHLIFFGARFYDPHLQRWLTPDPTGSLESPNLYLYVRNSPFNRLDLFGLYSEDFRLDFTITQFKENPTGFTPCRRPDGETHSNWVFKVAEPHKISFTPEEIKADKADLMTKFGDVIPGESKEIGLVIFSNGIGNTEEDFKASFASVADQASGCPLIIGVFTPTKGLVRDAAEALKESVGKSTPESRQLKDLLVACSETLHKVNSDAKCLLMSHSRSGATAFAAIKEMNFNERKLLYDKLIYRGIASARPLPRDLAIDTKNIYSSQDAVTGWAGAAFQNPTRVFLGALSALLSFENERYDIEFIPCTSSWGERTAGLFDHGIMGGTYRGAKDNEIGRAKATYGFFEERR